MNIIVAVVCNLIVALILAGGVVFTIRSGLRVAGLRLFFTIAAAVGAFFIVPTISNALLGLVVQAAEGEVPEILLSTILIDKVGMSLGLINSIIYLIVFMIFYLVGTIICNISKHCFIKALRSNKENKARIKRAKSINPKAEREAKKAEFKAMKNEYKSSLKWWRKLLSVIAGVISAAIVAFVVLTPVGYTFKFLNKDGEKAYLEEGYKYTINGLVEDKIDFDFNSWLVRAEEKAEEDTPAIKEEEKEIPLDEDTTSAEDTTQIETVPSTEEGTSTETTTEGSAE